MFLLGVLAISDDNGSHFLMTGFQPFSSYHEETAKARW